MYEERGVLGASALMSMAMLPRPDLRDVAVRPNLNHALAEAPGSVRGSCAQGDVLLHHPYDSFEPVLDFLRRAAEDPQVLAIKMTLYRAGSNAEAVRALMRAAENGKQVAVSIELKARFDEENNIAWAAQLERAGAHVFYGYGGAEDPRQGGAGGAPRGASGSAATCTSSTGNYNVSTARLYTDLGLFTADPELGEDVSEVFNALSGFSKKWRTTASWRWRRSALADAVLREDRRAGRARPRRAGPRASSPR